MKFPRFFLDVSEAQLLAVAQAGEAWLTAMLGGRHAPAAVAAMPVVAAVQARAVGLLTRWGQRRALGNRPPRSGRFRLSLTVPEAAGLYAHLGEPLASEENQLHLRLVRGHLHHALADVPGLRL